jgi:hypothetical protein
MTELLFCDQKIGGLFIGAHTAYRKLFVVSPQSNPAIHFEKAATLSL